MSNEKSYTAYYQRIPLGFWFYFWLIICLVAIILWVIRVLDFLTIIDNDVTNEWLAPVIHLFLIYSVSERSYVRYKNSKINYCFISINDEGFSWRLPTPTYQVKQREIIAWPDVKKIVIMEDTISIKYLSAYFSDTIPLTRISEEDKRTLLFVLKNQINQRSIVCEDRIVPV